MRKSMIFQSLFSLLVMFSILFPSVGRSTPREVTFFPSTVRLEAPREMDLDLGWRR